MELSELDRDEIARLITEGYTSGIIDGIEIVNDGRKEMDYRISWELKVNKFEN